MPRQNLKLRLNHLELPGTRPRSLQLPIQRYHLPHMKLVPQIGPAKPHALYRVQPLPHGHLEQRHMARLQQYRPAHLADHRRHRPRLQRAHRHRIQPVLIPKWQMIQQVLHGLDAAFGQLNRNTLPHAPHKLHRCRKFQHTPMLSISNQSFSFRLPSAIRDQPIVPTPTIQRAYRTLFGERKRPFC